MDKFDLIVIGGGPAGFTAGIYGVRGGLSTALFTGVPTPSQLSYSGGVENFPGFDEPTPGGIVISKIRSQAKRLGVNLIDKTVTALKPQTVKKYPSFEIGVGEEHYFSKAVVVATGALPKKLEIPGEKEFFGRGVSVCATCDAMFYRGKSVAVVGGGDSAAAEALHLSHFANTVYLIHRRDKLRACQLSQDQIAKAKNIKVLTDQTPKEITGSKQVEGITLEHSLTRETTQLKVDGVFVSVGYIPNTRLVKALVDTDERGFVKTTDGVSTRIPGLFAAGDIAEPKYQQAVIAASSGAKAALTAQSYIQSIR